MTLIDWGLADDFSGGLARAGQLYLDADGNPPKKGKDEALEGVGQGGTRWLVQYCFSDDRMSLMAIGLVWLVSLEVRG